MIETSQDVARMAVQPWTFLCPVCEQGQLTPRNCRMVCEVCGYVESCEDSFVPNETNPIEEAVQLL